MAPRNTRVNPEVEVRSPARSFAKVLDNYYAPSRDRRGEQAFQQGVTRLGVSSKRRPTGSNPNVAKMKHNRVSQTQCVNKLVRK